MGYDQFQFSFPQKRQQRDWYDNPGSPLSDVVFGDDEDQQPDEGDEGLPYGSPDSPYIRQMNQMMAQDMPAYKKYTESVAGVPRREQYEPNRWTKIAAALGGFSQGVKGDVGGAISTSQAIRNMPYQQAYDDWNRSNEGLEASAKLEYTNRKQTAEQLLKLEEDRIKVQQANASTAQARARLRSSRSYDRWVDQPSYSFYQDGNEAGIFDRKTGKNNAFGRSAASLQRDFQGRENAANRALTASEGEKNRTAANDRLFTGAMLRPRRSTITKPVDTVEDKRAEYAAMTDVLADPSWQKGTERYFKVSDDGKGNTSITWNPPPAADVEGVKYYNEIKKHVDNLKQNYLRQTMQIPINYTFGPDWPGQDY